MAQLSPMRAGWPVLSGLPLLFRGKVRDTYRLDGGKLLVVATDGISIFDFVLDALVPLKGAILNAMNHFWVDYLSTFNLTTHFIAAGSAIDDFLPPDLKGRIDLLQSRAMVVKELDMAPIEFIARGVLTGSSVSAYKKDKRVCGHYLSSGLEDGDQLPYVLDTPTTKAQEGHDESLSAEEIRRQNPEETFTLLQIFQIASSYAEQRGIKLADFKLEFGKDGTLGDEVLTPDSSRFWDLRAWRESRKPASGRKAPPPFDKQLVRLWGIAQGIDELDPKKPEDVAKVHAIRVPEGLIEQTTRTYRYIFWRLTGKTIEAYLRYDMRVDIERKPKNITILCGSENDLPAVRPVVSGFTPDRARIQVHIMSCHRNPEDARKFAVFDCDGVDAVICAGSKAFALPGFVDAFAYNENDDEVPVVGVALGEPNSKALLAAQLSIEELPGSPVVMDEISGIPYAGPEGLRAAIARVIDGELPPPKPRVKKPVQRDVFKNF